MIRLTKHLGFALLLLNMALPVAQAQVPVESPKPKANSTELNPDLLRWRSLLDQLAIDSRSLDENIRSAAVNSVADAYWEISPARSKELFSTALEFALAIQVEKDRLAAVNQVISSAARRDLQLTKTLNQKLLETRNSNHQALQASIELLSVDTKAAEAIAIASSSFGASFDAAWLVFQLQQKDREAADRVYAAYLSNPNSRPLRRLLWLSGYPFGHGEAFGGASDPVRFAGISGFNLGELRANRSLATAFLRIADESIAATLDQISAATPEQVEALSSQVYFTVTYLLPEVEKYRPDLFARWTSLQTNIAQRIDPNHREAIANKIRNILADRERVHNQLADEQDISDDTLQKAENVASSCERDAIFAKAAFKLSYKKDFKKALNIADKISALELRSNVIQFVYYDTSMAAMKPDSLNIDQAVAAANRVIAPEQRALLLLKLAALTSKRSEQQPDQQLLIEAGKLADRVEDPARRVGVILAVADGFSNSNLEDRFRTLKSAVATVNRTKEIKIDKISVDRRVHYGCEQQNPQWYGESMAHFNLIHTLIQFSESNEDQAVQLALDLDPGVNRIRSLAAVAGSAVKKLNLKKPIAKDQPKN